MSNPKIIVAIESGDTQTLISLIQNSAVIDSEAARTAIAADRPDCLKVLIDADCPLDKLMAVSAVRKGRLECSKVCIRKPQNYMPSGHII